MLVEFRNDFHNSFARVRIKEWGDFISLGQVKRLRSSLCGVDDCTCSGETGTRGQQPETDGFQHIIDFAGHSRNPAGIAQVDASTFGYQPEFLSDKEKV